MSEPFLAEIKIVGFNFAVRGWALCDGQLLPINQNQSLYSLLGTTYGGDGRTSFALPDLRGRVPLHLGDGFSQGAKGGEQMHALTVQEMASHTHTANGTTGDAGSGNPDGNRFAYAEEESYSAGGEATFAPDAVANTGSGAGHENMQPYLTLNFQIALQGLFPPRS
jgi:microcystin-dependent protein